MATILTKEELDQLVYEVEELGLAPARTTLAKTLPPDKVRHQVRKLRKAGRVTKTFPSVRPDFESYSVEEIRIIRKHTIESRDQRLSAKKLVALLPGRTESAIASFIHEKGWADPEHSQRVRESRARQLKPNDEAKIVRFIQGSGRYWTPSRLQAKFGISKKVARRLRKKHGLEFTHEEAMRASPSYQRWYRETTRQNVEASERKTREMMDGRVEKMQALMDEMLASNGFELKECMVCGEMWPSTADFFRTYMLKLKSRKKVKRLLSRCRACPSQ